MSNATRMWIRRTVTVGVLVLLLASGYLLVFWPDHKLQRDAQSLLGQPEAVVVARLGAPHMVVTAADVIARPTEAWWGSGWHPAPTYPVTNKVLLYYASVTGALIYISPTGVAERVHIVGT